MSQKLNLHYKKEYKTILDKTIITTLFLKQLNFSKQKLALKMKLLINLLTIISIIIIARIWRGKLGTLMMHSILLILSLLAVQTSQEDSLVKISDVNFINSNTAKRDIEGQLETRKKKHKKYFHNADHFCL